MLYDVKSKFFKKFLERLSLGGRKEKKKSSDENEEKQN
jgi:hypothetical protein